MFQRGLLLIDFLVRTIVLVLGCLGSLFLWGSINLALIIRISLLFFGWGLLSLGLLRLAILGLLGGCVLLGLFAFCLGIFLGFLLNRLFLRGFPLSYFLFGSLYYIIRWRIEMEKYIVFPELSCILGKGMRSERELELEINRGINQTSS